VSTVTGSCPLCGELFGAGPVGVPEVDMGGGRTEKVIICFPCADRITKHHNDPAVIRAQRRAYRVSYAKWFLWKAWMVLSQLALTGVLVAGTFTLLQKSGWAAPVAASSWVALYRIRKHYVLAVQGERYLLVRLANACRILHRAGFLERDPITLQWWKEEVQIKQSALEKLDPEFGVKNEKGERIA
jgi:hypothetical protein